MSKTKKLPARSQVKPADTWDLASLFTTDDEWEKAFAKWEKQIPRVREVPRHARRRSPPRSPSASKFDSEFDRAGERLGTYAYLKTAEDMADSGYQRMKGRYQHAATQGRRGGQLHPPGDPRASRRRS